MRLAKMEIRFTSFMYACEPCRNRTRKNVKQKKGKRETNLKWLMDCRTASSNSMGPGMSKAGCSGWDDILLGCEDEKRRW